MYMYKFEKDNEYNDDEIRDEFSDVIEAVNIDELYEKEDETIKIMKMILSLGVNRNDHSFIMEIIEDIYKLDGGSYDIDYIKCILKDKFEEEHSAYSDNEDVRDIRPDYSYGEMSDEQAEERRKTLSELYAIKRMELLDAYMRILEDEEKQKLI